MFEPESFVALGFVLFVGLMLYFGMHKRIGVSLDDRAAKIRDELATAERLRKEAAEVLASFESKRAEAEKQAQAIVERAHAEAEMTAKDADEWLADYVKRRTAQAEDKIGAAETQALAQVRAAAADAAIAAAEIVLRAETKNGLATRLVDQGIGDIKRLAH